MRGVNICCGRGGGGRLGMTVHCSHDSMCVQCAADSWERSYRPCDVNSQHQSVSWPAITIVTRRRQNTVWDFTISFVMDGNWQPNGEIICVVFHSFSQTFIHILLINKPQTCTDDTVSHEDIRVLTQAGNRKIRSKPCHFLYSISCSQHSLTFSCLHLSLFHLSLISLSVSLNLPPALWSPLRRVILECRQVSERGKGRAVEGNGSQNSQEHSQLRHYGTQISVV